MAQRYDNLETDLPYLDKEEKEGKARAVPQRQFKHKPGFQRQGTRVTRKSLASSSITNLQSVLTRDQLIQCADAYVNNGIVRTVVDKSVFFIQGDRTNFTIAPNDELVEVSTDQEVRQLEQGISDGLVNTSQGITIDIKELKRKCVRFNKRVKLHDRTDKLLTSSLLFGRNALEIIRLPPVEGETFGEPYALRHLNSLRWIDTQINAQSGAFEGMFYDEGTGRDNRFIPVSSLVPAFYDDNNLYDNTNFSGLSAVWPILSVSQADDVINDEDIPEAVKNLAGQLTTVYAGTNSQSKIDEIKEVLSDKRMVVHGLDQLKTETFPLAGNILQLPDVRLADAKYICMCLSLPLFLLFEDTANFATANQVMQVFKAGMLKRHRTWLQGILEDNWYDPILADHLGIELKDVISADIKIKAIFPDINFETRLDIVTADEKLMSMGVLNTSDVAKDIDRKDIVQRLEEEQAAKDEQRQDSINQTLVAQKGQIAFLQQQNQLTAQQRDQAQKQQVSAAASVKEEESQIRMKRLEVLDTMRKQFLTQND